MSQPVERPLSRSVFAVVSFGRLGGIALIVACVILAGCGGLAYSFGSGEGKAQFVSTLYVVAVLSFLLGVLSIILSTKVMRAKPWSWILAVCTYAVGAVLSGAALLVGYGDIPRWSALFVAVYCVLMVAAQFLPGVRHALGNQAARSS